MSRPDSADAKVESAIRARAAAAQARYWAQQAAERAPVPSEFEQLPIVRPEHTDEHGVRRTATTEFLRIPRSP